MLAGLICAAASLAAVLLLRRVRTAPPRYRTLWLATAGVATGFGVWATHFVAILGFGPHVVTGFHLALTTASLAVVSATATLGFVLAVRMPRLLGDVAGGTVLGLGIATMHYTGMAAVEMPGHVLWSGAAVLASWALAVLPTIAALRIARWDGARASMAAALLLMAAILLLHFTGMAAMTMLPGEEADPAGGVITPMTMAIAIGGVAGAVLLLGAGAAWLSGRADALIRANRREFGLLVTGITDCALYMLDKDGRVASWNAGAERLKGYTADEVVGLPLERFYTPDDRTADVPARGLATALREGKFSAEGWRCRKDGGRFWAHVTIEKVCGEDGALLGFAKITRDMTRFKEDQDRLARLAGDLDTALAHMHQGLVVFDADERNVLRNPRVLAMFGVTDAECPPGMSFREILRTALVKRSGGPVCEPALEEAYRRHKACLDDPAGGRLILPFPPDRILSIAHSPVPGGGWVSTFEDITELRRSEERIAHMAQHDSLTDLPNRASFNRALDGELRRAGATGRQVAVVVIDLDGFKEVNDARGHAAGDETLRQLARRFREAMLAGEFVARIGGDEFAAFKGVADSVELDEFVRRLGSCAQAPMAIEGYAHEVAASLGVALFPDDGTARESLVNNADLAMYRAKPMPGTAICRYEPGMDEAQRQRRLLGSELRQAIANDALSVVYQVQRCIRTDRITGYEALLRWYHPERGWVSPAEFIPLAEEIGEIGRLGEWVLRTACAEAAHWDVPHKIAVNISPLQLTDATLTPLIAEVLLESGLPPKRLELEITESAIIADKLRALHLLRQIKALGVTIALDDFGTGYSSLDTLSSFPFDKIKIDKSFMLDSASSAQARAIIRTVLALGKSLGIPVLAEGIETEGQLQLLRDGDCEQGQGYLFGRPQNAARLPATWRAADIPRPLSQPARSRAASA